jgi:hypothetical protein
MRERDVMASLRLHGLRDDAELAMRYALRIVRLKLEAVRALTEASQVQVVQDTEELERKALAWFDSTRAHFDAISEAAFALRDAADLSPLPPSRYAPERKEWLRTAITEVRREIVSASDVAKSYERDPIFMYLNRLHNRTGSSPLGSLDRRLAKASHYDDNSKGYRAALRYAAEGAEWLATAEAELSGIEAISWDDLYRIAEREGVENPVLTRVREAAESAARLLVDKVDSALVEFSDLDDAVNCLLAREGAASRVNSMLTGTAPVPMPLEEEYERTVVTFANARVKFRETADRTLAVTA